MATDLCVRTTDPEALQMAKALGFSGLGILGTDQALEVEGLDIATGVELTDAKHAAASRRRELVIVTAPTKDAARRAMETPLVDVVFADEVDDVMVKLAKRNKVAIGFDFSRVLHAHRVKRGAVLASYEATARLVRKFDAPFVLTSGARSAWDLRSPSDLAAFGRLLGLADPAVRVALSGSLLRETRKKLSGKLLIPGVELL